MHIYVSLKMPIFCGFKHKNPRYCHAFGVFFMFFGVYCHAFDWLLSRFVVLFHHHFLATDDVNSLANLDLVRAEIAAVEAEDSVVGMLLIHDGCMVDTSCEILEVVE